MQASPMRRRRLRAWGLLAGALLLALAALASLALGSRPVPLAVTLDALQAVDPHDDRHLVVRELRLPRTLVALLAGAALGVAGALMQALTRNPLAEPGLLGINAGAALAVIVGVALFDLASMGQYLGCAFLGAGLAGIAVASDRKRAPAWPASPYSFSARPARPAPTRCAWCWRVPACR